MYENIILLLDRNGEVIVKFKHIAVSILYLLSMFFMASPKFLGLFGRGALVFVLGVVLMLAVTAFYGMYIYNSFLGSTEVTQLSQAKESEYMKYRKLADWFAIFRDLDRNFRADVISAEFSAMNMDAVMRSNPFRNTELGKRLQDSAANISVKYEQTMKILSESFNQGDITYQNYLSVMDNVMKLSTAHLRSIKKRICVFDYRTYSENINDSMCVQYIDEVNRSVTRLEEIDDKFDHLIHELVCLNEISEEPLLEMQSLIESTSDYKSLEE